LTSGTLPAYRSTGTCCAPKTCSSRFLRSLIPPKWMILSPRRALDVYTERIPPSLCLWGWLLGWIHSVDPWDLLTLHQGSEPSTSEVLCRWIVHERRSTLPLFQIYTIRNWKQSMKNSFKHFIKHLECKLYINPKNKIITLKCFT